MSMDNDWNAGFTDDSQRGARMFQLETPRLAWLSLLAEEYLRLSGQAFADMKDTDAQAFREAAKSLLELQSKLPPLGEPAGPVMRGSSL